MKIWTHRVATDEDFTEATFLDISVIRDVPVAGGRSAANVWPTPALGITSAGEPADAFMCGPMEVISERVAGILRKYVLDASVEYLPVSIEGASGRFYALNVLDEVDALDRTRAVFTEEEDGTVNEISSLALREDVLRGRHLTALDAIERVWIVSNDLADAITAEGIRGTAFQSPDEWTPY